MERLSSKVVWAVEKGKLRIIKNIIIGLLKWRVVWYNRYRNEKEGYNAGT